MEKSIEKQKERIKRTEKSIKNLLAQLERQKHMLSRMKSHVEGK